MTENNDDSSIPSKTPKDYPVGYRKPPVKYQFKAGHTVKSPGRPKGSLSFKAMLRKEGHEEVSYKDGDTIKKAPKIVVVIKSVFQKAMKGDVKATELIFSVDRSNPDEPETSKHDEAMPADDYAILKRVGDKRGWTVEERPADDDWSPLVTGELRYRLSVDGTLTFELMPFTETVAAALVEAVDQWVDDQAEGLLAEDLIEFIFDWIKRLWAPSAPALEPHRFAVREMVTSILTKADGTVIVSHAGDLA